MSGIKNTEDPATSPEAVGAEIPPSTGERRVLRRTECALPTRIRSSTHSFPAGIAQNVSVGGMFVQTNVEVTEGSGLDLVVTLPDHSLLTLPAIVRWTSPEGFGVQFGALSREETGRVLSLLES